MMIFYIILSIIALIQFYLLYKVTISSGGSPAESVDLLVDRVDLIEEELDVISGWAVKTHAMLKST